jgi:hypothetical protein
LGSRILRRHVLRPHVPHPNVPRLTFSLYQIPIKLTSTSLQRYLQANLKRTWSEDRAKIRRICYFFEINSPHIYLQFTINDFRLYCRLWIFDCRLKNQTSYIGNRKFIRKSLIVYCKLLPFTSFVFTFSRPSFSRPTSHVLPLRSTAAGSFQMTNNKLLTAHSSLFIDKNPITFSFFPD